MLFSSTFIVNYLFILKNNVFNKLIYAWINEYYIYYTFEWTKQLQNIIKRFLTNFRYFYYVNIVYLEYLIVF